MTRDQLKAEFEAKWKAAELKTTVDNIEHARAKLDDANAKCSNAWVKFDRASTEFSAVRAKHDDDTQVYLDAQAKCKAALTEYRAAKVEYAVAWAEWWALANFKA